MKKFLVKLIIPLVLLSTFVGCTMDFENSINQNSSTATSSAVTYSKSYSLEDVPSYSGDPYVILYDNKPNFSKSEITTKAYEYYGKLDSLGRCTTCVACVGQELAPVEKRGEIGSVKPSGWHSVKYDNVDGKYLYNRCHLIGYQLTGENANPKNLITGTRELNTEGMLPFENMVDDYIEKTNNHVMYRVTPIFSKNELVARGVQMEALSVEDEGKGVCFNVYCYNNQKDIEINYQTGESKYVGSLTTTSSGEKQNYVVNLNSRKYHKETCSSVESISQQNKKTYFGYKENLEKNGYVPCSLCKP